MTTRLLLNGQEIATGLAVTRPALDFLRQDQGLTGAKAGCREGDCGACGGLVGERLADGGLAPRAPAHRSGPALFQPPVDRPPSVVARLAAR